MHAQKEETPGQRRLFWGIVIVFYSVGYALTVWVNRHYGAPLNQALLRAFTTLLLLLLLQAPLYIWYKKRIKGA